MAKRVDTSWATTLVSLVSNNYQIIIPLSIADSISVEDINELTLRGKGSLNLQSRCPDI
jgi:hypothetical protein